MRRAAIAERLLTFTTTSERAAAVVGDLLEEEQTRGHGWFWIDIARTGVAFAWLGFFRVLTGRHTAFSGADIMAPLADTARFIWRRKWLVIVPVLLLTMASTFWAYSRPVRYRSQTSLIFVPQRISEEFVRSRNPGTASPDLIKRLRTVVTSRTRLERIANEFNLFSKKRFRTMQDAVEEMQNDSGLSLRSDDVVEVSFTADDPLKALKVTERLATLFIDEWLRENSSAAESTSQFLEEQIAGAARQLDEAAAVIERAHAAHRSPPHSEMLQFEVLQQTYRELLAKREQARMAANLEIRQIGMQIKLLEPARLPIRPEGVDRVQFSLAGAAAGLVVGLVLLLMSAVRRPPTVPPLAESTT